MKLIAWTSIILSIFIFGCDDHPNVSLSRMSEPIVAQDCEPIVIQDAETTTSGNYSIDSVSLVGHSLMIAIKYGGGCGSVEFEITANPGFMESLPVQSQLTVIFKDDDPCKALIHKQYCFDLQPLASEYKASYQTASGTILLRIPGYVPLVSYSF